MSNSTKVVDYLGQGTHAARPATPPVSSSALALYRETDTGILSAWTGAAWTPVNGPVLIGQTITSGSAASVTFSSISAAFTDLELRVSGRSNVAAVFDNVLLQFNGDTGANYDYIVFDGNGSAAAAATTLAGTSLNVGQVTGSTGTAGRMGATVVDILGYAQTTFDKEVVARSGVIVSTAAGGVTALANTGGWRSTAAINAIKVFNASTWVDGTIISLYGHP